MVAWRRLMIPWMHAIGAVMSMVRFGMSRLLVSGLAVVRLEVVVGADGMVAANADARAGVAPRVNALLRVDGAGWRTAPAKCVAIHVAIGLEGGDGTVAFGVVDGVAVEADALSRHTHRSRGRGGCSGSLLLCLQPPAGGKLVREAEVLNCLTAGVDGGADVGRRVLEVEVRYEGRRVSPQIGTSRCIGYELDVGDVVAEVGGGILDQVLVGAGDQAARPVARRTGRWRGSSRGRYDDVLNLLGLVATAGTSPGRGGCSGHIAHPDGRSCPGSISHPSESRSEASRHGAGDLHVEVGLEAILLVVVVLSSLALRVEVSRALGHGAGRRTCHHSPQP